MKVSEIHNMTDDELRRKISDAYQELMNLRFQFYAGQVKNTNRLKEVKKDIARMRTVWRERELEQLAASTVRQDHSPASKVQGPRRGERLPGGRYGANPGIPPAQQGKAVGRYRNSGEGRIGFPRCGLPVGEQPGWQPGICSQEHEE